ncbi:uncharacterized protein IWZ02DRAFT_434936 [Phyllosticta citriasiana]|uniref:uncharacterized protein n=1 Tax=Phyllosticta citriasiana TaxID=595635 RepID=UPI0030FD9EA4
MDHTQENSHCPPPRYSPPGYFSEQIQSSHNELAVAAPMYGEVSPPLGRPRPLQKPVVVPPNRHGQKPPTCSASGPSRRSCGANSPALAQLPDPITQDEFLAFVGRLNEAYVMHPFFQASFVSGGFVMAAALLPGGPGHWLNSKNVRGLAKVRGKRLQKQQERAIELAGESAQTNRGVAELERLAQAQESVEGQLLENQKDWSAHAQDRPAGDRQIDHELAAASARRDALMEEIRRAGEGKMKKADKKEERIANRILWIVITRLDGTVLGYDEIMVDTPSEQSSIV